MYPKHRSLNLDVLRAVAVLLVLLRHLHVCPQSTSPLLFEVTSILQQGGWVGVDIFFVLSGFLIGGLLFQEYRAAGQIQYGKFLIRRGFKIYPLFWIALGLIAGIKVLFGAPAPYSHVLADFFFVANYFKGVVGVSWSLGVEEHFYILLPAVLIVIARTTREPEQPFRRVPKVAVGVFTTCLLLRALAYEPSYFEMPVDFTPTHLRIDGLLFGVLLAYWFNYSREQFIGFVHKFRYLLFVGGVLGLIPAFLYPISSWYIRVPGFAIHWLSGGALICAALAWSPEKSRLIRIVAAVGRQSYATYLFHTFIGSIGLPIVFGFFGVKPGWYAYASLYITMSLVVGAGLTWAVERPILIQRDRMFPAGFRSNLVSATDDRVSGVEARSSPQESEVFALEILDEGLSEVNRAASSHSRSLGPEPTATPPRG